MKRAFTSKAALASVVAALALACAVPPRSRLPATVVEGDTAYVTVIPFELFDGRINVRAVVNGDSGWLVLDSGTGRTALDRAWALGNGVRFAWAPDSNRALVDTIRVKTITLRNYGVNLFNMREVNEGAGRFQFGILGAEFLRRYTVEIDYGESVVRLYDRMTYRYGGAGVILPFVTQDEFPWVDVSLLQSTGDSLPAHLLLDTGNGRLCLILMTPYVDDHNLTTTVVPHIEGPLITGLAGPLRVALGTISAVRVGGLTVDSVPTGLGRERKSFLASTRLNGLLGGKLFDGGRLILDYARRRAIIEPGAPLGRDCKYDESGLILTAHGAEYRQYRGEYVVAQSPAADAGVRLGDWVLSIDGRPARQLSLPDIRDVLAADGAVRQLRLARESDTVLVTLHLHRLF